jgi:5-methylthioadenosine/S-adenosylhomocysteine deaminase
LHGVHAEPTSDVYSRLVYACGARDVRHVFVDGLQVVRDSQHQTLDSERVVAQARAQARRLVSKAAL